MSDEVTRILAEVHGQLGPGLPPSIYESCVSHELRLQRIPYERQRPLPFAYKGARLDCGYRLDLVVRGAVLVEIKSVDRLLLLHTDEVVTYLRLADLPVGLLVNFNVAQFSRGVRRLWRGNPPLRLVPPVAGGSPRKPG
jgi:GxxExxY protein